MFMSSTSTRIARQARKVGNAPKNAVKAHRAAKASDAAAEAKLANLKAKGVHLQAPAVEFNGSSYRTVGSKDSTPATVGDLTPILDLMMVAKGTEAEAYFTNLLWEALAAEVPAEEVPAEEVVVGTALLVSDTVVIPKVSLIRKVGKVVKVVVLAVVKVAVFVALWAAIIYAYLCVLLTAVCLIVIALGKLGIIKTEKFDPAEEV